MSRKRRYRELCVVMRISRHARSGRDDQHCAVGEASGRHVDGLRNVHGGRLILGRIQERPGEIPFLGSND